MAVPADLDHVRRGRRALRAVLAGALACVPAGVAVGWFAIADRDARQAPLAASLYWSMPLLFVIAAYGALRRVRRGQRERDACTEAGTIPRTARSTDERTTERPDARTHEGPVERTVGRAGVRAWLGSLAVAAALTATVGWLVPARLRVQFDESTLVGASQVMHEHRRALITSGALPHRGELVRIENMVDKRPPLFAFATSVVHDVCGPAVGNAFVVNTILLGVALAVVGAVAGARRGAFAALAAPLLLLAVPLTSLVATSAGFELLAAVLLLVTLLAANDFVRAPDAARWTALVGAALLLAAARYESLFVAAMVVALAAVLARGRWRADAPARWLTLAAPTLLAPLGMLLVHASDATMNFTPEAGGGPTLAWAHLRDHTPAFLVMAFADWRGPLTGPLAFAAAAGWTIRLVRREATRADLLVVLPVAALTLLALAWFFGDVADPGAWRLFLPFCWFVGLSPLLLIRGPRSAIAVAVAAAALATWHVRELAAGDVFPPAPPAQLTEALDRRIDALALDRRTTLWIATPAQHLIVRGHAAVSAASFARVQRDVQQLVRQGDVRTIVVLETPLDAAFAPAYGSPADVLRALPHDTLPPPAGPHSIPLTVHRLRL